TTLQEALVLEKVKPETYLLLGRLYHREEKITEAIESLEKYKKLGTAESEEMKEAELLLSQSRNAKAMMASPVKVKVDNLGPGLNSKYDDKNPCISADGKSLVFTTRRPETTNSPTDIEGDGKYFENIYIARPDSATGEYGNAESVGKMVNTSAHDACTSI